MTCSTRLLYPTLCLLVTACGCAAADPESFRIEVTGSAWLVDTTGTIQGAGIPVDLRSDLGVEQRVPNFSGQLVIKPARKHRLVFEGTPYRLDGDNTLNRSFTFRGRTYTFQDRVLSHAEVNYIFGGYQYDFLSRASGHLGLQFGVGYLNASGTLTSTRFGFSATESRSVPFPLAGIEGRAFAAHGWIVLSGLIKGMDLGSYGHYVQGAVNGGIGLGRHISVLAGYQVMDADLHSKSETSRIAPRLTGPIFSVQVRE
jgi:hypothetical protein